jgi:hypothetical protein
MIIINMVVSCIQKIIVFSCGEWSRIIDHRRVVNGLLETIDMVK